MRDDEIPYIVIEREGSGLTSFVVGALVGAGLALLFAPRTGEETQAQLREKASQFRDVAEDRVRAAQRDLEARLDRAREGVEARVGQVRDAVEAGREAARDARADLEQKLERSRAAYQAGVSAARDAAAGVDLDLDADDS